MKAFVYSLVCPIDNEPRYIGSSTRMNRPKYENTAPSKIKTYRGAKREWFEKLRAANKKPIIEIIHEADHTVIKRIEGEYTKTMRELGFPLVNIFDGCRHNEQTKAWVIAGNTGRKYSKHTIKKMSESSIKHSFKMENGSIVSGLKSLSEITGIPMSTIHYKIKLNKQIKGVRAVYNNL